MNFDFTTKEGRLSAAKEFGNELKEYLTEEEAVVVSYSNEEHILTNSNASPRDMEGFITAMLSKMPKLVSLILLRRVMQHLVEDDFEN